MPRRQSSRPPVDPPTIAELRQVRRRMWRKAGGTVEGLMELARREAAKIRKPAGGKRPKAA